MEPERRRRAVMVVDDDQGLCALIAHHLRAQPLDLLTAHSLAQAADISARQRIDVVLLDQKLPDGSGVDFCPRLVKQHEGLQIIFMTAYPSFSHAVEALKAGAHDYLAKPFELEAFELALQRSLRTLELEQVERLQTYRNRKEGQATVLVGAHGGLAEASRLVDQAANTPAAVLITGETGTGKGVVAKAIHYHSDFRHGPFLRINCGALPEHMIESELFGHERGAFTGAERTRKGIFEMASGGTLFLDEIGTLPRHLQSKLLGVLDDQRIRRVGGQCEIPVECRVVAATNMAIEEAIQARRFRADLYYRLGVVRIHLPPLRERPQDIPDLCRHFLRDVFCTPELVLPAAELQALQGYPWPGNVRELRNTLERALILRQDNQVRPSRLLPLPGSVAPRDHAPEEDNGVILPLDVIERRHILKALARFDQNRTQAAEALGISRSTLKRKLNAIQLDASGPK